LSVAYVLRGVRGRATETANAIEPDMKAAVQHGGGIVGREGGDVGGRVRAVCAVHVARLVCSSCRRYIAQLGSVSE
jgi:hypothetical protein